MSESPMQTCKYCGRAVTGEAAISTGAGFVGEGGALPPLSPYKYRFECPGPHDNGGQERVWYWSAPDPAAQERDRLR